MVDLAEQGGGNFIPLKDISERQRISHKYLESIMSDLSKAGLVEGQHGKGGGYSLRRRPEAYTAGEILRITEGELAPVACLEQGAPPCALAPECRTLPMWKDFYRTVNDYFDKITLADLMKRGAGDDYMI